MEIVVEDVKEGDERVELLRTKVRERRRLQWVDERRIAARVCHVSARQPNAPRCLGRWGCTRRPQNGSELVFEIPSHGESLESFVS